MACFPILRAMVYGFVASAISFPIAMTLFDKGIISDDVAIGLVTGAYVVVGLGRLLLGTFIDKN